MNHEQQLSAEEFDRRFEAGEDISAHVDWAAARRPNKQTQRVNVRLSHLDGGSAGHRGPPLGREPPSARQGVDCQLPCARFAQRQIRFQSR